MTVQALSDDDDAPAVIQQRRPLDLTLIQRQLQRGPSSISTLLDNDSPCPAPALVPSFAVQYPIAGQMCSCKSDIDVLAPLSSLGATALINY